jgi:ribulose-phosphate 3-epimerase
MFHIEAATDPRSIIQACRDKGMKVGLAIKPKTSVDCVLDYLHLVDMVLVMTVEPGFGGQAFMPECLEKVYAEPR